MSDSNKMIVLAVAIVSLSYLFRDGELARIPGRISSLENRVENLF